MVVPASKNIWLKQAAISISLAQFSFTFVFVQVLALATNPNARYLETAPPGFGIVWALLFDVLLLAIFLFICCRLSRHSARPIRVVATSMIAFFVLFAGFQVMRSSGSYLQRWFSDRTLLYVGCCLAGGMALWWVFRPRRVVGLAQFVLLVMSPLYPIAALNALQAYQAVHASSWGKGSAAGMLPQNLHRGRVIWLIFDELDQHLLFESRPERVHLEEFDALRAESIYATHVSSPNPDTMPSLPSLIMGRTVGSVQVNSTYLHFQFQGCSDWKDFSKYPNVFSRARAAGFNTGLSGWHHSYCRLIGNDLSACAWGVGNQPFLVAEEALQSRGFFAKALYLAEWEAESLPVTKTLGIGPEPGGAAAFRQDTIDTFQYVMTNGMKMVRDPRLNVVLLHIPIPHPPGIWDSRRGSFTTGNSNYVDNLQLANDSLRQLRLALQAIGEWENSTVLVSSDHPYRVLMYQAIYFLKTREMRELTHMKQYRFVPFLVKLPNQHSELTYTKKFNSVLSSDLLMAALERQISTPEQAVHWLDEHADASLKPGNSACE